MFVTIEENPLEIICVIELFEVLDKLLSIHSLNCRRILAENLKFFVT